MGRENKKKSSDDRIAEFWSRVDQSGGPDACWLWTGPVYKTTGYGQAPIIAKGSATTSTTAHRVAWILTHGDPGTYALTSTKVKPLVVRHRCPGGPNRLCCNPSHLAVGTHRQNAEDKLEDGTQPLGERTPLAKLTDVAVREARIAYANGVTTTVLARRYGVSQQTMGLAVSGKTWKHVDTPVPTMRPVGCRGAKLTADAVRRIRSAKAAGASYQRLSEQHGVAVATIQAVVARRTWAHIPEEF